ncbi:hypothetical protein SAMD00019534_064220 [Acytostelium subglobosum LB1]|uniref:hypothetical protein n=1 Tax=Acytostelium subglobosum LB1 TaxID=1410327 RepID=UPI000644C36A|nr:hypothetical protein SAMD00019534_064220 [Acytostelium subglobosum LB1]GAM23247.1 hypothetical protein SAMD00019534_064220 [Acytostelium subglobosum LB1]|eukprot:XP_012753696.1 hypothetical protein SAMD00019534_064220 [Acytostelium subglobosum LB1]
MVACGEITNAVRCLCALLGESHATMNNNQSINGGDGAGGVRSLVDAFVNVSNNNNNNNSIITQTVVLSNIEEAITRVRLSELLLQYTFNHHEARYHLEKARLLLDTDSTEDSLELLCKISSYLTDFFISGNAINLSKQWIKKGLTYSSSMNNQRWKLYFLIKNTYVLFIENQPKLIHSTLDQALKMVTDSNDDFSHSLVKLIKTHYSLMYWDYTSVATHLTEVSAMIKLMGDQLERYKSQSINLSVNGNGNSNINGNVNVNSIQYPQFFQQIFNSSKSNQTKRMDLMIRDVVISFEQLRLYYCFINVSFLMRVGDYKQTGTLLEQMQVYFTNLVDMISVDVSAPLPIFSFGHHGIKYMSVVCYLMFAIHARMIGELQKSLCCLANALKLIDGEIAIVYAQSRGELNSDKMSEIRSILRLKFMVHENMFYIRLTHYDLDSSFIELQNCVYLFQNHPLLFTDFGVSAIHTLSALYLQALGHPELSKPHIDISLHKAKRFDVQILSIIRLAIYNISTGEMETAKKIIRDYLSQLENHPQLLFKTTSLFLDGITQASISPNEAKEKFKECLDILNTNFTHSQLTTNVLISLARLYLQYPNHNHSHNNDNNENDNNNNNNTSSLAESALMMATVTNDLISQCNCNMIVRSGGGSSATDGSNGNILDHQLFERRDATLSKSLETLDQKKAYFKMLLDKDR